MYGQYPRLHPRHIPVEQAKTDLLGFIIDLTKKYGLTLAERCLVLSEQLGRDIGWLVRYEREGKGD